MQSDWLIAGPYYALIDQLKSIRENTRWTELIGQEEFY